MAIEVTYELDDIEKRDSVELQSKYAYSRSNLLALANIARCTGLKIECQEGKEISSPYNRIFLQSRALSKLSTIVS